MDAVEDPTKLLADVSRTLDAVEAALGRLDDGTYGRCDGCGGPIGDGAMADDPLARRCSTC